MEEKQGRVSSVRRRVREGGTRIGRRSGSIGGRTVARTAGRGRAYWRDGLGSGRGRVLLRRRREKEMGRGNVIGRGTGVALGSIGVRGEGAVRTGVGAGVGVGVGTEIWAVENKVAINLSDCELGLKRRTRNTRMLVLSLGMAGTVIETRTKTTSG